MNFLTFLTEMKNLAYKVYGASFGFNIEERIATINFKDRGADSAAVAEDCLQTILNAGYEAFAEARIETDTRVILTAGKNYTTSFHKVVVKLVNEDPKNTTPLLFR